ncbi:WS/DGAT/MGAT family O-acyltransferase [Jatrophihabitans fulvus]
MPLPMSPTSSMFLLAETRNYPMHVGGLQLFRPPAGADVSDIRAMFDEAMAHDEVAPLFLKRPRRSLSSLGQWAWERDEEFDLEHHVRRSALPSPGRIRELLELVSRLHSTLLDRQRPLWETHLIEGLDDGRFAVYTKVHHALVDGVSALRMLSRMLSEDPDERSMPAPWAPKPRSSRPRAGGRPSVAGLLGEAAGLGPSLLKTLDRARRDQAAPFSFSTPRSMFNVKITGARRFAAQSWPIDRIRAVGRATDTTVNDVVLAMCSGALRRYLISMDALPDSSLTAMVPISLHSGDGSNGGVDGGGNAVGMVICRLGTDLDDAGARLAAVHHSMEQGKETMGGLSHLQVLAMSGLGISPLGLWPALNLVDTVRPPFNLVISNVPGPRVPLYWNGAQMDGLYPLSIPLDGQALNITCTSYSDRLAFGLTGCRRSVPHLQHLLTHLDEELAALEKVAAL